jgi:hypothetical protein
MIGSIAGEEIADKAMCGQFWNIESCLPRDRASRAINSRSVAVPDRILITLPELLWSAEPNRSIVTEVFLLLIIHNFPSAIWSYSISAVYQSFLGLKFLMKMDCGQAMPRDDVEVNMERGATVIVEESAKEGVSVLNFQESLPYEVRRRIEVLQKLDSYQGRPEYKEVQVRAAKDLGVSDRSL